MAAWGALHTWWIREKGLSCFQGGRDTGKSIAAIKVLLALSLRANFYTHEARVSISELENLTGLSRPMVVTGTDTLEAKAFIEVDREAHVNLYRLLVPSGDKKFGKLPARLLISNLKDITNRGAAHLAALKVYLLLIANRPNSSNAISYSHERIREETGIQTRHVRQAIDVLINHSLLHVNLSTAAADGTTPTRHNVYTLQGISAG